MGGVIKHGMYGTRLYECWASMQTRCKGTSTKDHKKHYHDKGIRVCNGWRTFEPFMQWALENGYSDKLTIDRKDNDGPYSPGNCRWSTAKQQANNRASNRWITFSGSTKTLSQWDEYSGFRRGTIGGRLRCGWSIEAAITEPSRGAKS